MLMEGISRKREGTITIYTYHIIRVTYDYELIFC